MGLPVDSIPGSSAKREYSIESVESAHNNVSGHVKVRVVDVSCFIAATSVVLSYCFIYRSET